MLVPQVSTQEEVGLFGAVDRQAAARILLVEDEAFVREVTCEVLRASGYEVLATQNAVEALEQHDQWNGEIDLLLTDIVLPDENGRVLAGKLRQKNSGLKVLFVTGYSEQLGLRSRKEGDYLAKPFSSEVLLTRVRSLLNRRFQSVGN